MCSDVLIFIRRRFHSESPENIQIFRGLLDPGYPFLAAKFEGKIQSRIFKTYLSRNRTRNAFLHVSMEFFHHFLTKIWECAKYGQFCGKHPILRGKRTSKPRVLEIVQLQNALKIHQCNILRSSFLHWFTFGL